MKREWKWPNEGSNTEGEKKLIKEPARVRVYRFVRFSGKKTILEYREIVIRCIAFNVSFVSFICLLLFSHFSCFAWDREYKRTHTKNRNVPFDVTESFINYARILLFIEVWGRPTKIFPYESESMHTIFGIVASVIKSLYLRYRTRMSKRTKYNRRTIEIERTRKKGRFLWFWFCGKYFLPARLQPDKSQLHFAPFSCVCVRVFILMQNPQTEPI